jgi:putative ABC transport system permease protein
MRELLSRLIDWFRRDTLDRELAEELAFHRQQLENAARSEGIDAADARYVASRQLGNVTSVHEDARERWSWPILDRFQQDVRFALRGLRRSPGYTTTVLVTLALGIGANVAMFSVIDRLMFRPLAMLRDPVSVSRVYLQSISRGEMRTHGSMAYKRYLDLKGSTSSFSDFAAFSERPMAVGVGESSRERRVGAVSASFFTFFDATPALGRFFTAAEDVTPRGADVAVLSYNLWKTEFGGRDVRGEILQVGTVAARIIGVTPQGFSGVNEVDPPAVFIPITTFAGSGGPGDARTYFTIYQWGWMNMLVRRKPGMSEAAASADLTQAFIRSWELERALEPEIPTIDVTKPRAFAGAVKPWAGPDPALEGRTALWLTGIAGIVLIIACANVANLALARALRRQRETAVRLALGAGRRRLVMQSVIENLVLALGAAALGLILAQWGGIAIRRLLMTGAGMSHDATAGSFTELFSDWRMFGFGAGIAVLAGLITSVVPALLSARGDLAPALRGGARGGAAHRTGLRAALLMVQGGLTVMLLVGAGLFVRSLANVQAMPMGYDVERVLRVNTVLRGTRQTTAEQIALRRRLLAAAQALPDVEAAAWTSSTPFLSTNTPTLFVPGVDSAGSLGITAQATTPDYFKVMSTRILRGRALEDADQKGSPLVAIVSVAMARVLWPGKEAIGQCIRLHSDTMPCTTVVGIAEDMVQRDLTSERYHFYMPIEQSMRTQGNGLLLKLRGDPVLLGERVRKALQREMPGMMYVTVQPLQEVVAGSQRSWRMGASLLVIFGALALLVAAVGLYGVISYNVAQRMHELGVRIALGATPRRILQLVVGQSMRVVFAGVAIGTLLAVSASKWVQPLLFNQSAKDPLVYLVVAAVMFVVAVAASSSPAVVAAKADPNAALRAE